MIPGCHDLHDYRTFGNRARVGLSSSTRPQSRERRFRLIALSALMPMIFVMGYGIVR